MGEVISVIEELRGIRAWLDSEAGQLLAPRARIDLILSVADRKLRWAESVVSTRGRLLELVSVEVWLQELLVILDEVAPGDPGRAPGPHPRQDHRA
jgi:hypothetical protein